MRRVRRQGNQRQQTGDDLAESALRIIDVYRCAASLAAQRDGPSALPTHVLTRDHAVGIRQSRDERIMERQVSR
jgi:hypothetical protein